MAPPAVSPLADANGVVVAQILVAGRAIPDSIPIESIIVRQIASRPGRLDLTALNGPELGTVFKPGSTIELRVGYGQAEQTSIFLGTIGTLADDVSSEASVARVVAEDALEKLREMEVNQVFIDVKKSDIVAKVCGEAGIAVEMPATNCQYPQFISAGETALDLLQEIAADLGLVFHCVGDKIVFTFVDAEPAPVLAVTYGESLIHFAGGARPVPAAITYSSWNLYQGEAEQATVNHEGGRLKPVVRKSGRQDPTQLRELADGAARELKARTFAGRGACQGSALLSVGVRVELDPAKGAPGELGFTKGAYFVTACEQTIENGNWISTFNVGLADALQRPDPAPSPVLPGIVRKIAEDPLNHGRFAVSLPTIGANEFVWAYPMVPYNGFWFPHDIGDQVLVSFVMDDPSVMAIVGALPGRKMLAAYARKPPADNGRALGELAYGKAKLQLGEDAKGTVTAALSGPTVQMAVLDGIGADSRVVLAAPGKASAEVSARNVRLSIGPSQLNLEADVLSASSSVLKLSANGNVEVKGGMITLNDDALKVI